MFWILVVVLFCALVILMLMPSPRDGRPSYRVMCASNLRQIGQGIYLYANDNAGQYPPTLGAIVSDEDLSPDVLICPSSSHDVPTKGPTTQAVVAELALSGHNSYVYIGTGLNSKTTSADAVIAYEANLANHDGSNVLFGDGHVSFETIEWMKAFEVKRSAATPQPTTMPDD